MRRLKYESQLFEETELSSLQQHTVQQFSTCYSAAAAILFPDPGIYATALVPLITMIFIYIQGFEII